MRTTNRELTSEQKLTDEQKAERRRIRNETIAAVAIFGSGFGLAGTAAGLEASGVIHAVGNNTQPKKEQSASTHPGSSVNNEMPSSAHLKRFAHENGINFNHR